MTRLLFAVHNSICWLRLAFVRWCIQGCRYYTCVMEAPVRNSAVAGECARASLCSNGITVSARLPYTYPVLSARLPHACKMVLHVMRMRKHGNVAGRS